MLQQALVLFFLCACYGGISVAEEHQHLRHQKSRQTQEDAFDLCISVIAIAGSPDYDHFAENGVENSSYEVEEEFVCELRNGYTIPIQGSKKQIDQMRAFLNEGLLVSSETTVEISQNQISMDGDENVYLPPGDIVLKEGKSKYNESIRRTSENGENGSMRDRGLSAFEGKKEFLVVRVTDKDGKAVRVGAKRVSDDIFGTYGDSMTMKSQFSACSFGKMDITYDYSVDISDKLSAPGVLDVEISVSLSNSRAAIRNAAVAAAQAKLGFQLPGLFQHVMFVVEGCYEDCGWAAYAYVNSWLSVFQGAYFKQVGVQLHEIGHNLNLAHSGGLDGLPYTDHTCMMGNPLYGDDLGGMCFNPAKNFQIARKGNGWYNEKNTDTVVWNSGSKAGTQWSGTFVGVADYDNNRSAHHIVLKVETGTSTDLFVGFNAAKGINSDNVQASNEVTVVESGNDGLGYSQSFLKATLKEGETYVIPNWRQSGQSLTIRAEKIDLKASPSYADVSIHFGASEPKPTSTPTSSPVGSNSSGQSCGNAVCDWNEDSDSCSEDCIGIDIATSFEVQLGSTGSMFAVKATRDVVIKSMAINSSARGVGEVKVFTRKGSYVGHEQSSDGWIPVYENPSVTHNRRSEPTELGDFDNEVHIEGDTVQSFFVTSTVGLAYTRGTEEFAQFVSDGSLSILEGIGTTGEFSGSTFKPRVWGGVMRYDVPPIEICDKNSICGVGEDADSCPADCAGKEIETTFEVKLGSNGNMFSVEAVRDIEITSFAINAGSRGVGTVKVYTRPGSYSGHEQSSSGWTLIYDNSLVTHNPRGEATELGDFEKSVRVAADSIQSFFVMSTKGLAYTAGTNELDPFVSDGTITILEGIGTTDEFSGVYYFPRIWGGKIRYDIY